MKNYFKKKTLNFFINFHNYCYKKVSLLVVELNRGIHPKHRIMDYHKFFTDNVLSSDIILDLGSGNGFLTYDISKKVRKVVAIDMNEYNISYARKNYSNDNIDYILGDVLEEEFEEKFDKIVLSNVLEHIEGRVDFLKKLHNYSNEILLRVPMVDRDWLTVYKKENGFDYMLDDTHYVEYTFLNLKQELKISNWKIKSFSIQFGEFWGIIKSMNNYV